MNWIREIRKWASFTVLSLVLVCMPIMGCRAASGNELDMARMAAYIEEAEAAEASGDLVLAKQLYEKAAEIQQQMNEEESGDIINYVLGWIPWIPNSAKGALAAVGSAAVGSLFYERPRSNWKKVGGAVLDAVRGLGNGKAMKGAGNALYAMKAVVGFEHTERASAEPTDGDADSSA